MSMTTRTTDPTACLLRLDPSFMLGGLLALYFLVGRWTFGRLNGGEDTQSLVGQPRVWIIGLIMLLACLIYSELTRRGESQLSGVDLLSGCWFSYFIASAMWAPNTIHLPEKLAEMVMMLMVGGSIALARSRLTSSQIQLGFWSVLVLIGGLMGCMTMALISDGRVYIPTGGPNVFGRNMGLVGIGALILSTHTRNWIRWGLYAIVLFAPLWVVLTGSRGALLSLGVAGVTLFMMTKVRFTTKLVTLGMLLTISMAIFWGTEAGRNAARIFEHRVLTQTIQQRYTTGRIDLYLDAYNLGMSNPTLGAGLSGFRASSTGYPHNIVLEAFSEGGFVGVLLLLGTLLAWWLSLRKKSRHMPGTSLAAVALLFTAACFSGDFYDSRGLFLYLAIAVTPIAEVSAKQTPCRPVSLPQANRLSTAH